MIGCNKYLTRQFHVLRQEAMFGEIRKYSNPVQIGDEPELDNTKLLGDEDHRKFRMLIGMDCHHWEIRCGIRGCVFVAIYCSPKGRKYGKGTKGFWVFEEVKRMVDSEDLVFS